ncbi:sporulation protein YhbH [Terribacillus sp. DMT04]|uniref:sporulation protein YhbH n=1 Tax=Terribacillus sp. DMT04 TaxID=2850441 RepID=UPI001C2B87A8|nr:sporulation protein YhbH [Terribacillus sp. DMT04]QXE02618.1 sporulation protein YhbH [Terribacillus sp. DMT04]
MTDSNHFAVSEEDWSLHRKGYDDQKRHQDKVQEVLKNKLPDLITEENIIMSNGKDLIKIPIRSLDEYKIRYSQDKNKHAGQGKGNSKVGDVLGRAGEQQKAPGKGQGEAGDQPGHDYYEAEVSFEELEENFYSQLELPNLVQKDEKQMIVTDIAFNDIRKTGLTGNIDKKRTMLEAFKRNALGGSSSFAPIYPEDVRYKTWDNIEKPDSKAVVLAMLDTSGSMGNWEKYVARSFFFWMTRFLRTKYETVEIEFIAHHTEANVVDEESFFSKGESGGTICSSAYKKALQLIDEKYPPSAYNIYPFHFSDGDNLTSDNSRCVGLINQLIEVSSLFGYGEVNQYNRHSTLMQIFRKLEHPKFKYYVLRKKTDVFYAMQQFFSNEKAEVSV